MDITIELEEYILNIRAAVVIIHMHVINKDE